MTKSSVVVNANTKERLWREVLLLETEKHSSAVNSDQAGHFEFRSRLPKIKAIKNYN